MDIIHYILGFIIIYGIYFLLFYSDIITPNLKIVKFTNGKYAIRKGNWTTTYMYCDLTLPHIYWHKHDSAFKDCLSSSVHAINVVYNEIKLKRNKVQEIKDYKHKI